MKTALAFLLIVLLAAPVGQARSTASTAIAAPVLKWQRAGCYVSWCETGWYASPAVADLDKDGAPEVIGGAYTVFILNGATGAVIWTRRPSSSELRGLSVYDLDGDGT